MTEIGSEFWEIPIKENNTKIFPESTQWFLSGRSALQAIIQDIRNAKTVAMPSWCCDSMIKPFLDAGIKVKFYPVHLEDKTAQEIDTDADILFLMNYFGYSSKDTISHPCIIRDLTHSIFSSKNNDAKYYFGSLRKWCGVWTGGFAWTDHKLPMGVQKDKGYAFLRDRAMQLKKNYIDNGNIYNQQKKESIKREFLKLFNEAENILDDIGVVEATERDVCLSEKIDWEYIKKIRRTNAKILMEAFPDWLIFNILEDNDCPMFVPLLVPDGKRNDLRQYLIENEIYCPVHWPASQYHKLEKGMFNIYENELSLVCDQRYTENDMDRMVEIIKKYWKGKNECYPYTR